MNELHTLIIVSAITGAGLITGLLFAFSNFVMKALAELPADKGMYAMQRINIWIVNPLFMLLFTGTPVLCLLISTYALFDINTPGSLYLLTGSILYLIGPFGVTLMLNVPLNNLLARTDISNADEVWPMYQKKWQYWNHIRTYLGVVSMVILILGITRL